MKLLTFCFLFIGINSCAQQDTSPTGKDKKVGGNCECCEGIYEQAPDFNSLNETVTLPGFNISQHKMLVYGTIYKIDGTTPAAGVVPRS